MTKKKVELSLWIAWVVIVGICYYVFLRPLNIHNPGSWMFIMIVVILPVAAILLLTSFNNTAVKINLKEISKPKGVRKVAFYLIFFCVIAFVLMIVLQIYSGKMFHAKRYASMLEIKDKNISEDLDELDAVSKIALMDSNSARILGDRKMGSLTEVVSQFSVDNYYSQIDLGGSPVKVAALHYDNFLKFIGNYKKGVPGYIKVDPVGQKAEYVKLKEGMKYVPGSYFNKKLERHLRFSYPTAIMENIHFEVDEKGNPFYIASVVDYKIGLFGGKTIKGAIVCDPVTGESAYYKVKDIPRWVDGVFDGDLLVEQYNWYGLLNNGYFNSILGKKGCKKCTETIAEAKNADGEMVPMADYGYIAKDGDIWIYTGVTSVNDDASNIGFIMVNQRTQEAHAFAVPGADENSAMAAAEGEVQEKGYKASFPSLINVDGTATYVMVLKDASGIVKLYSMVNVEQYNLVTTSSNLDDCFSKYRLLITGKVSKEDLDKEEPKNDDTDSTDPNAGTTDDRTFEEKTIQVASISYITIEGDTWIYITDPQNVIYKQKVSENEQVILIHVNDVIKADCALSKDQIYDMKYKK